MYKTLELTLDTERTNNTKTNAQNFLVNTNDYESIKIIADIVQDKERVDLSDTTVKLAIRKPDKTIVFQDGTVTAAVEGECEFVLETQSYVLKGTHVAEVMIYFADGKIVVTRAFAYHVAEGILTDTAIESTSWYQDVNELQLAVQELQVEVDAFIDTAVAETRAEITEVDQRLTSQLADKATRGQIVSGDMKIAADADRLKLANMADEVLQAIAGTASINTTPAPLSTTTEKIAPKAVTPDKTSFFNLSRNLFDKTKVVDGNLNEVTGEVFVQANYQTSDFTPVVPSTQYTMTKGYKIAYYDANKVVVAGGQSLFAADNATVTTPANAYYARYSVHMVNAPASTYMFVQGASLPSTYEAFGLASLPKTLQEKQTDLARSNFSDIYMLGNDIVAGTDLNLVKTEGNFTGAANGNYVNVPNGALTSAAFMLENRALFKGGNRWYIQTYTEFSDLTKRWSRRLDTVSTGTTAWQSLSPNSTHLTGKTTVCLGDSTTEFGTYPTTLANRTGMNVLKCGFGGTRLAYHTDANYDAFSMSKLADSIVSGNFAVQQVAADASTQFSPAFRTAFELLKTINFNTVDYIVMMYGTNDYMGTSAGSVALGQAGDTTPGTFYGAMDYIIEKIQTSFPHVKIVFVTPTWRENASVLGGGEVDTTPNPAGVYLKQYVDAMIARAHANHLPVLDLFRTSGINKYTKSVYLADTVHPTTAGYEYVGSKIGRFMLSTF